MGSDDDTKPNQHPGPRTIPHAFGFKPEIDLNKLNQLVDDLESEAYAASLRRRSSER